MYIVLDNYSVHKGRAVKDALEALEAAGIHLFYLPAYSPELSRIEPVWKDVKHNAMPVRSFTLAGDLKRGVDAALREKAQRLRTAYPKRVLKGEGMTHVCDAAVQTVSVYPESVHSLMEAA